MKDTKDKLENILSLASDYISETKNKKWEEGEDWVSYSGPYFDYQEYLAALKVLLDGWMIFGKNARQFEIEFPKHLGMVHGSLTNSGSSALLAQAS